MTSLWMKKTQTFLISTISAIHGPDSQQPIVTATEKRKSSMLMLSFFKSQPPSSCCCCHYSMFKMLRVSFYYHPLLSSFLGLLLCVLVFFLSILAIALPLPPPPFLHIIQVQPPARMHTHTDAGMQCCNKNMHILIQNVERNIFSHRERMASDWWAF